MSAQATPSPLAELRPITDAEAAQWATAGTHDELLAAITSVDPGDDPRRAGSPAARRHDQRVFTRPLALAGATAVLVAALLLALPGLVTRTDSPTQPSVADAAILRGALAALERPRGTIMTVTFTISMSGGGSTATRWREPSNVEHFVVMNPDNGQIQTALTTDSLDRKGSQAFVNSYSMAVYDPVRNTIYSMFLPHGVHAAQFQNPAAHVATELRAHRLHVVGPTEIDGQAALELASNASKHGQERYYVKPGSYIPLRMTFHDGSGHSETVTVSGYALLPATAANRRLLSLQALHPTARRVRGVAAFNAAADRLGPLR